MNEERRWSRRQTNKGVAACLHRGPSKCLCSWEARRQHTCKWFSEFQCGRLFLYIRVWRNINILGRQADIASTDRLKTPMIMATMDEWFNPRHIYPQYSESSSRLSMQVDSRFHYHCGHRRRFNSQKKETLGCFSQRNDNYRYISNGSTAAAHGGKKLLRSEASIKEGNRESDFSILPSRAD